MMLSIFLTAILCGSVAECLGRWICDQQVAGLNPGLAVDCNPGQVVNTHVPLSPRSIIWYHPAGGDAAGKVTVGLASLWLCITYISGFFIYGLKALERELNTHCALLVEYGKLYLYLVYLSMAD